MNYHFFLEWTATANQHTWSAFKFCGSGRQETGNQKYLIFIMRDVLKIMLVISSGIWFLFKAVIRNLTCE